MSGRSKTKKVRAWYAICIDCDWQSDWCTTCGESMRDAEEHSIKDGHATRAGLVETFRVYANNVYYGESRQQTAASFVRRRGK